MVVLGIFYFQRHRWSVLAFVGFLSWVESETIRFSIAQEQSNSPAAAAPVNAEAQALLVENSHLISRANELIAGQKFAEALPLAIRISQNLDKASSPQEPAVSKSMLDVSELYKMQGDSANALVYSQKAMQSALKLYPEDSLEASRFYYHLQGLLEVNGKYSDAEKYCRKAIAIQTARLGAEHLDTSTSLNDLAVILSNQGKAEESVEIDRKALAIREKSLPANHPWIARSLSNLAKTLAGLKQTEEAISCFERAIKIWAETEGVGRDSLQTASDLVGLSGCYFELKSYPKCESSILEALAILKKQSVMNEDVVIAHRTLSLALYNQERYDEAEVSARDALDAYKRKSDPRRGSTADDELSWLVSVMIKTGRLVENDSLVREHYQTSIEIHGEENVERIRAELALAAVRDSRGQTTEAKKLREHALSKVKKLSDQDLQLVVARLTELGAMHLNREEFLLAQRVLEYARPLAERETNASKSFLPNVLSILSIVKDKLGDQTEARKLRELATQETTKTFGEDSSAYALMLNTKAEAFRLAEDVASAEPLYRKAIQILERHSGRDTTDYALVINNLGVALSQKGKLDDSKRLFEEALAIREKHFGRDHALTANSIVCLASTYSELKQYELAEAMYLEGIQIREKHLGFDHEKPSFSRFNLSQMYEDRGRIGEAARLVDSNIQAALRNVSRQALSLTEREQQDYLSSEIIGKFLDGLTFGLKNRTHPEAVQSSANWLINVKGIGVESVAERNFLLTKNVDSDLSAVIKNLTSVRKKLANIAETTSSVSDRRTRESSMKELVAEEQTLIKELSVKTGGRFRGSFRWLTWQELSNSLPENSVWIDFAYFPSQLKGYGKYNDEPNKCYAAWIVFSDSQREPVLVDLGAGRKIESLAYRAYEAIHLFRSLDGNSPELKRSQKAMEQALASLSDALWKPLSKEVGDTKRVIISPDMHLWMVPWNALPSVADPQRYLIEDHCISLVSGGREVAREERGATSKWAVAMANPNYDQSKDEKSKALIKTFKKLPDTSSEPSVKYLPKSAFPHVEPVPESEQVVRSIQSNLEKYVGSKAYIFTGDAALESVAKRMLSPKVILFLTHGYTVAPPEKSALARLFGTDSQTMNEAYQNNPMENPLLRCGVLLSGCNHRNAFVGDDDGVLTGAEIALLNLQGTELVFLGSCQSAVGDMRAGMGVGGLQQAFHLAGAKAVMGTIWSVPVVETNRLTEKFFEKLADGTGKAESLRAAQLDLIETHRKSTGFAHPLFWAGYSLTGM